MGRLIKIIMIVLILVFLIFAFSMYRSNDSGFDGNGGSWMTIANCMDLTYEEAV